MAPIMADVPNRVDVPRMSYVSAAMQRDGRRAAHSFHQNHVAG